MYFWDPHHKKDVKVLESIPNKLTKLAERLEVMLYEEKTILGPSSLVKGGLGDSTIPCSSLKREAEGNLCSWELMAR